VTSRLRRPEFKRFVMRPSNFEKRPSPKKSGGDLSLKSVWMREELWPEVCDIFPQKPSTGILVP
jgi:hypothetical protein